MLLNASPASLASSHTKKDRGGDLRKVSAYLSEVCWSLQQTPLRCAGTPCRHINSVQLNRFGCGNTLKRQQKLQDIQRNNRWIMRSLWAQVIDRSCFISCFPDKRLIYQAEAEGASHRGVGPEVRKEKKPKTWKNKTSRVLAHPSILPSFLLFFFERESAREGNLRHQMLLHRATFGTSKRSIYVLITS